MSTSRPLSTLGDVCPNCATREREITILKQRIAVDEGDFADLTASVAEIQSGLHIEAERLAEEIRTLGEKAEMWEHRALVAEAKHLALQHPEPSQPQWGTESRLQRPAAPPPIDSEDRPIRHLTVRPSSLYSHMTTNPLSPTAMLLRAYGISLSRSTSAHTLHEPVDDSPTPPLPILNQQQQPLPPRHKGLKRLLSMKLNPKGPVRSGSNRIKNVMARVAGGLRR
ncbi:hypothetical protein HKX48_008247 [Thoreauomyces humboldtii]|nr:hypothetical protein HKX48_008247 [Thoreauomyces humboldtii]